MSLAITSATRDERSVGIQPEVLPSENHHFVWPDADAEHTSSDGQFVGRVALFEFFRQPGDLLVRERFDALPEGAADATERIILSVPGAR